MDKEDFQIPRLGSKRKSYEREEQENDKQRPYERKEEEKEDKSRERRKEFMLAWLSSFPEDTWDEVLERKNDVLSKHSFNEKVAKPKPFAPVILKLTNTTELGSSLPDTRLFKFPLNPKIMNNPTSIM
ncbi:hypothetical protein RO3G_08738 [Rhizopus delemar RA 99-880]|uniref:Uncharacterized protein n=1 Tax=Rhizopus delemar (strain RA 99-880 / ATCC MYA-4621 / FGSC 9543 / NRRL 43880) TaxID=246409 RepID=I1C6F3_RHIO9|nr:hypothetical protein RO3G_08738 [Rhizopus delemar RA 99-880]|eukprot:EIE84033.1 hypothetical protein RO3G_08738 [Rhizopus delemar RA 99-880]